MADDTRGLGPDQKRELEQMLQAVEEGRLDSEIVRRYVEEGTALLGDDSPILLDHRRRTELTRAIGKDPGHLRLHTGPRAAEAAEAMGARAFALGERDIFLGSGVSGRLDSPEGKAVLAHEATHSLQKGAGVGFARPGTVTRDKNEALARRVEERVLAREDSAQSQKLQEAPGDEHADDSRGRKPLSEMLESLGDDQKEAITRRVMEILRQRSRFESERIGLHAPE